MKMLFVAAALATTAAAGPSFAQQHRAPAIAPFGAAFATEGAMERPDPALHYRVVFPVTKASADPAKPNASLERVARFLNLLAADGVRVKPGEIVAILYGPATPVITNDAVYAAQTKAPNNPNIALIAKLKAAGVVVAVCGQALQAHKYAVKDVAPGVRVDVSAMTTMANLQLRGWALLPE
jgi:intracellular sulfur oxidation DsrE/DsrF family protein